MAVAGFAFDAVRREFNLHGVPVHLVTPDQAAIAPKRYEKIEDSRTVSLADLINMKLYSGTRHDPADVIGLIRKHDLGGEFARLVHKSLRVEYRKLAKAARSERA